jgi:probable addiction module antidote protein
MAICPHNSEILEESCHLETTVRIKMMGEMGMKERDSKQFRDNPTAIAEHLTRALATDDLPTILAAIHDVLRAQNVSALSRVTGLRRDRLYKTFGGEIDPDFSRILKVLKGLDVQLTVKPREVVKPKPPLPKLGRPTKATA